ncbi:PAS domain-containing protein [Leptolyngbya sp. FACHB-16]|uniref:PAS domain-containing protein n=1 Tax=unclassified Leptolyngbya TaxID=2650499 RepID=UPI001684E116|nr:PAS domain-containing protein [Leptolyngbya sp. FACHB-8]MBD2156060.1 PAS domain-containing protein [Leptolyngbya sp. FACHB-16]
MYRIALSLLALVLAHGMALLFRVQPAVSLWFPPSGVAIALTLWQGPIGAVLAGVVSVFMAPLWGSDGWSRWVGGLDALEPLVAWLLYCYWFRGPLALQRLRDVLLFLVSVPLAACFTSALVGCLTQAMLGRIAPEQLEAAIGHWWLGNALGTMAITPLGLLSLNYTQPTQRLPFFHRYGRIPYLFVHPRRLEVGLILVLVCFFAILTVSTTQTDVFETLQLSLLGVLPLVWAVARFGVWGGVLTASFTVLVTLVSYLMVYPNAIAQPIFPVDPQLLHTHKLSLLLQTVVTLVIGVTITERETTYAALAVERVKRAESETRAHLNERLIQVMRDSHHLVQQVTDTIPQVLYVHDLIHQRNIYVNRQIVQILGYTPEEVQEMGENVLPALLHPEDLTVALQARDRFHHLKNGEISEVDYRIRHANGEWRWLHCREMVFARDALGEATQILGSAEDTTERRQAEAERHQLISLIESSTDFIALATLEGQMTFVNAAGRRFIGLESPDAVKQTHILDCFQESDRPYIERVVLPQLSAQERWQGELQLRHLQNGQLIPMLVNAQQVRDSQTGRPIAYATVSRDISERKQAELALSQANERFQLAVAALSATIYDWNCVQKRVERTEGLYSMLGFMPEEVEPTYDWWWRLIHPQDQARVQQQMTDILAGSPQGDDKAQRYSLEYRMRHRSGHYVYIHDQGLLLRDDAGQAVRMVGNLTDISERKQAEVALQESEERLRLTLYAANQGLYDFNVQTGVVIVSSEYAQMLGYDPNTFVENEANWRDRLHPDDREHADQIYQDYVAGSRDEYRAEFRQRTQTGEWKWILSVGKIVSWDEQGQPLRMLGTYTDITERRLAEAQNRQLASIVENSTDFIGIADLNGNLTFLNKAGMDLVGLTDTRFDAGIPFLDYFADVDREWIQDVILSTVLQYGSWQGELQFKHFGTGELIPVFYNLFVIRDPITGQPASLATVTRDFRERKRIERVRTELLLREQEARKQAESASRMKDEFLAIVSHELRSPLNGILGWSQLLRTRSLSPEKTEQALASIERNAQAQTQLIEDLLDISRIIRGQVRLTLRPLNLATIVQAALDTIRPTAEAKSIQLITHLDWNTGPVSGDSERLQQVVWNLLSNAVKFTPTGGQVEVRLATHQTYARIQVMDTGKGINAEFLPFVFDRFRQADATTTRNHGGLGLGLAIVRNLVELHGGNVSVTSAGEGQGATFIVELPLLPDARLEGEEHTLGPFLTAHPNSLKGLKVLVVDDEKDTREFLVVALEQAGAIAISANSAQEALQAMHRDRPHILLSDIGMPDEDGYALIRQIRALPPELGGNIPAAAITAYVRGGDRQKALTAGFQMHISKPIDPTHLLQVVAQLAQI